MPETVRESVGDSRADVNRRTEQNANQANDSENSLVVDASTKLVIKQFYK